MEKKPFISYYVVVRLQPNVDTCDPETVVDWRYPAGELPKADKTLMGLITQFCFPDKEKFPKLKLSTKNKMFTFVVTNVDGLKRFGYCHRELTVFNQALDVGLKLAVPQPLEQFCLKLAEQNVPLPGDSVYISLSPEQTYQFSRPADDHSLTGFTSFAPLLENLDPFVIVSVMASLLLERRVIFVSSKLSTLSTCVQACVSLLYPLVWQHVFIPVLPLGMIQFVCAPVPFVVGLLVHHLPELETFSDVMEEVYLVDLDNSNIVPPPVDYQLIPEELVLALATSIHEAKFLAQKKLRKPTKSETGVAQASTTESYKQLLELGFVEFFANTIGHYRQFLSRDKFNKEAFCKNKPDLTKFLEGLVGSQMFEQFIVQRQSETFSSRTMTGRFEKRLTLSPKEASLNISSNRNSFLKALGGVPEIKHLDTTPDEVMLREGWLEKFGKGLKGTWAISTGQAQGREVGTWQDRYFKMSWTKLTYHKSRSDPAAGTIALSEITEVVVSEQYQGRKSVLEIRTKERTYYAFSDNLADIMSWLDVLQYRLRGKPVAMTVAPAKAASGVSASSGATATAASAAPAGNNRFGQKFGSLLSSLRESVQKRNKEGEDDDESGSGDSDKFKDGNKKEKRDLRSKLASKMSNMKNRIQGKSDKADQRATYSPGDDHIKPDERRRITDSSLEPISEIPPRKLSNSGGAPPELPRRDISSLISPVRQRGRATAWSRSKDDSDALVARNSMALALNGGLPRSTSDYNPPQLPPRQVTRNRSSNVLNSRSGFIPNSSTNNVQTPNEQQTAPQQTRPPHAPGAGVRKLPTPPVFSAKIPVKFHASGSPKKQAATNRRSGISQADLITKRSTTTGVVSSGAPVDFSSPTSPGFASTASLATKPGLPPKVGGLKKNNNAVLNAKRVGSAPRPTQRPLPTPPTLAAIPEGAISPPPLPPRAQPVMSSTYQGPGTLSPTGPGAGTAPPLPQRSHTANALIDAPVPKLSPRQGYVRKW